MKIFPFCTILLALFIAISPVQAKMRIPVKLESRCGQGDWVGKRLVTLLSREIQDTDTLKVAKNAPTFLVCEIISTKIHNRPSCAYSYVIYTKTYGKAGPILTHYLGVCSSLTIKSATQRIIDTIKRIAMKWWFSKRME